MTPIQFFSDLNYKERNYLDIQLNAWSRANKHSTEIPINHHGKKINITIQPKVLSFNLGVNAGAKLMSHPILKPFVKLLDKFSFIDITGWKKAEKDNQASFNALIQEAEMSSKHCHQSGQPLKAKLIDQYIVEINNILDNKTYKRDNGRAYSLPLLVNLLSHEIGMIPAWNCKSGKDRTGLLDSELKEAIIKIKTVCDGIKSNENTLSDMRNVIKDCTQKLPKEQQQFHTQVLLNSGNLEIQKMNTGLPGYKVFEDGILAVKSNTDNILPEYRDAVRGYSQGVST